MYTKRRPAQPVYGKSRTTRHAELLWDEAITASPIKPYHSISEVKGDDKRVTLAELDVNRALSSSILQVKPSDKGPVMAEPCPSSPQIDSHNMLRSPLAGSTPVQKSFSHMQPDVVRSHIIFDSRESSLLEPVSPITNVAGKNDTSSLASSLSSLPSVESLGNLTAAFERLETNQDDFLHGDLSIALDKDLQDIETLLNLCDQLKPEEFTDYADNLMKCSTVVKIGEASFSEVFLGTSTETGEQTVYKIIPFGDGHDEVPINDVIQELRISSAMSSIAGFVKIKGMKIVQGSYPTSLLEIWDSWAETHESESDRPDWYKQDQRYCVVALENGGKDLEHFEITTWRQALDVLREIVATLARGETEKEFEHRDLHWGNILIRHDDASARDTITIIDYTLSRALVHDQLSDIAYYGFADREIFEAEGDDYQFDVYRLMRDLVTDGAENIQAEDWTQFHPSTNALWIHYLVDKLLYHKELQKPALRISKRNPILDDAEIEAWKQLDGLWKLLNPSRKYKYDEKPIDSACRVLELMN